MSSMSQTLLQKRVSIIAMLSVTALSMIGNNLTFIAIPWFVLQTTGSALKVGLTSGVITLAIVLSGIFGGPIVDRLGFKRSSIAADLCSGIAVALIPLIYVTIGLYFWLLLLLVFVSNVLNSSGANARQSLIPILAENAGITKEKANSAYQAVQRVASLVGPLVAGILILLLKVNNVLWIDAVTFLLSACVIFITVSFPSQVQNSTMKTVIEKNDYFVELMAGLRFIWQDRLILALVIVGVISNMFLTPLFTVIMPVYVQQTYGKALYLGLIIASFSVGSLGGAILFGAISSSLPRRLTYIIANVVAVTPFLVLALAPPLIVSLGVLAIAGFALGPLNPIIYTIIQERTSKEMLGRVNGAFTSLALAAVPFGSLLEGYIVGVIGVRFTLYAIAICYAILCLSILFNSSLYQMKSASQEQRNIEQL